MKKVIAFGLSLFYSEDPLRAAAREGEVSDIERFLKYGIYDVNKRYDGLTALYQAVLSKKPESILILLKYGADPNVCSKSEVIGIMEPELPLQVSVHQGDISTVRLLLMHGSETTGITFFTHLPEVRKAFEEMVRIKQDYDDYLGKAKRYFAIQQYEKSLKYYKKAGDVWYSLSQTETLELYKTYYQEQALVLYHKAADCFEQLSAVQHTEKVKAVSRELFEQLAELAALFKQIGKAIDYAVKAAHLTEGIQKQPYPTSIRQLATTPAMSTVQDTLFRRRRKNHRESEEEPLLEKAIFNNPSSSVS